MFATPAVPNLTAISVPRMNYHLDAALKEELAAAEAVDGGDGDEGGEHVDEAGDDGGHERGRAAESDGLEEDRRVEHDDVDAGELLQRRDQHRHHQLRPVPALEERAPRVLDGLGRLAGGDEVVVLRADVVGATDAAEHGARLVLLAAGEERVGGVGEEEGAAGHDDGRDGGEAEADAPPPPSGDLVGEVVDEVGGEDADGDHELEADVQHAPHPRRRHLRQVQWHSLHIAMPTPMPRRMRPMMSMATSAAAPLRMAPTRKMTPPPSMVILRPNLRVMTEAKSEAMSAAR
ncbi:Os01g0567533 [Oryza sativa Japonica Group]|uniref:Os01g0567533 protein n=1 Tax=Oryza sativa subsp. japonica TaxID=39947 RepID=A0A0P0V4A3_ORYSJ|nr:hypothetical protein EE612_003549 [Oryza sativa]BAS72764.1 Os01g0567533 [Oryza sativa Japonica Group]